VNRRKNVDENPVKAELWRHRWDILGKMSGGSAATLVVVDDDPQLLEVLALELCEAGYAVHSACDGKSGLELVNEQRPDAVILDVNMPVLDGFSLCRRLRAAGNTVPIVLLTARDSELDEALGLELGADDYVTKPFSTRVLLARVATLLRREQSRRAPPRAEQLFELGALRIDGDRLELHYAGQRIETTLTELRLIEALARRAGRVLTRSQILETVRGDESVVMERIVDTYVRRIRQKLSAIDPSFDRIETVIGAGYRWRDD
jgi:DNA-binding response OmpR family regulator